MFEITGTTGGREATFVAENCNLDSMNPESQAVGSFAGTGTARRWALRDCHRSTNFTKIPDIGNHKAKRTGAYTFPAAFTFTAAASGICTKAAHGMTTGDGPFRLSTTTTLPAGLAAATDYWVIVLSSSTYSLATSYANAIAGTAVAITGAGTGTHTQTQTQQTVNHYCFGGTDLSDGVRPKVFATPQGNELAWVTGIGATQFTLNRAAGTNALVVDWCAEVTS